MKNRQDNPQDKRKAALLAVLVHVLLLGALLISFNWKAAHQAAAVTEVELWESTPKSAPHAPPEPPPPQEAVNPTPQPEPKPEPEPEPEPEPKEVTKPTPEPPKVDIALEKKKAEEAQKRKNEAILKKLQQEEEAAVALDQKRADKKQNDALKKLQQEALAEENAASQKESSAAQASMMNEYAQKIKLKIRAHVNKSLCEEGNPEVKFEISLSAAGELIGAPKFVKGSNSAACDEAIERAIIASQPLPMPDDAELNIKFRNLNLKFKPNE